jgi:hypothetical protein
MRRNKCAPGKDNSEQKIEEKTGGIIGGARAGGTQRRWKRFPAVEYFSKIEKESCRREESMSGGEGIRSGREKSLSEGDGIHK